MAVMMNSVIDSLNNIYTELYDKTLDIYDTDVKMNTANQALEMMYKYQPVIKLFKDEIKFNGEEFYLQYRELPVGIEFYETEEDFSEAY